MSFARRYVNAMLGADSARVPGTGERAHSGLTWWRRYLASLLGMPLRNSSSPRTDSASAAMEDVDETGTRLPPGPSHAPWRKGSALTAMMTGFAVLAAAFLTFTGASWLHNRPTGQPHRPSTGHPPESADDSVLWTGFLDLGQGNSWNVDQTPPKVAPHQKGDFTITCLSACHSALISGSRVAPGDQTAEPQRQQCTHALTASPVQSVNLQIGRSACFMTKKGHIGYLKVYETLNRYGPIEVTVWK
ncbi:hypothetical protein ACWD4B_22080 [Streptomyces sp. NPDC002536]